MSRTVVIYPGGFQPFHQGHLSSYLQAKQAFPNADFYVASSSNVKERPIPFEEKKFLAMQAGVDPNDFPDIIVRSPMNPKEILDKYDPNKDIFVLVRSERDPVPYVKKDGSPAYFQPYTTKKKNPFGKNGYVFVTKKQPFKVLGNSKLSGTDVRDLYKNSNDASKMQIIKDLYPNSMEHKKIKQLLDMYIGNTTMNKSLAEFITKIKPYIKEATTEQKVRLIKLLEDAKKKQQPEAPKFATQPDPEMVGLLNKLAAQYPIAGGSKEAAFLKFVQRALQHSEQDSKEHSLKLQALEKRIEQIEKMLKADNKAPGIMEDHLPEK